MQEITSNLMNTQQVLKAFAISPRTLSRWRASGKVPKPVKDDNYPRWYAKDIEAALIALKGDTK